MIDMKKREQLQLTLDNSKTEEAKSGYKYKTQKLFQAIRNGVMRYQFLMVLPWPVREFDLWNVFNEELYRVRFIECSSYLDSRFLKIYSRFLNVGKIFSSFFVIHEKIENWDF